MNQIITNKEDINNIIDNKIKNKKLIFTFHYNLGIDKREISHKRVKEIFPQFDKVCAIEIRKLKQNTGYELYYKLNSNHYFSIATCPEENKLIIIHAIEYYRKLNHKF